MNKLEAIDFLTQSLPFAEQGEDYQTLFDGKTVENMQQLLNILSEEYGELNVSGKHPDLGDIYVVVELQSDVIYKTVSPVDSNIKAMQAIYALVP